MSRSGYVLVGGRSSRSALRHTSVDWNLIPACDMPEVSAVFLENLLAAAESSGALAAVETVRLPVADWKPFQNVNTPEDWATYAG